MNTQNVQNGTMNVVRSMATSVLFLVGTIGYSVYVLFELLGSFTGGSEIMNMFNNIMAQSGAYSSMDYQSLQILSGIFGSTSVISTLLGLIPAMVVFCQVLFLKKSVGIPFFQQGIFLTFSGHHASRA